VRLGYRRDLPDPRDRKAEALLGAPRAVESVSLRGHVGEVLDQGPLGSCVANAIAKGLQVLWSVGGESPAPLVSRLGLYYQSRAYHGAQKDDGGTYPRLAFRALREYGFGLEGYWPYDPALYATPPAPALYQHSFDQSQIVQYHRCSDDPTERPGQIVAALASLKPVCLGIQVDRGFMDDPGGFWRYSGPSLGGHYVCAVGANAEGVLIVNSWGTGWGEGGYTTIAWDTVCDAGVVTDPYVLHVAPRVSEMP
jgi:C1A family cysteine protease